MSIIKETQHHLRKASTLVKSSNYFEDQNALVQRPYPTKQRQSKVNCDTHNEGQTQLQYKSGVSRFDLDRFEEQD